MNKTHTLIDINGLCNYLYLFRSLQPQIFWITKNSFSGERKTNHCTTKFNKTWLSPYMKYLSLSFLQIFTADMGSLVELLSIPFTKHNYNIWVIVTFLWKYSYEYWSFIFNKVFNCAWNDMHLGLQLQKNWKSTDVFLIPLGKVASQL